MKTIDEFKNKIICGDCIDVMKEIDDNSIDTIVTDSPYGLSFMGKEWDNFGTDLRKFQEWTRLWAVEAIRVAKPGATMLCFGGTRTWHRLACGLEDAGWQIKDTVMWLYGQGFPKSLDIGKGVDKLQGNKREVIGSKTYGYQVSISKSRVEQGYRPNLTNSTNEVIINKGNSEWEGYGTALKPAWEPIIMAMKPNEGSYVNNALKWGVAGLNIDESRINHNENLAVERNENKKLDTQGQGWGFKAVSRGNQGRFPSNLILECTCDNVIEGREEVKEPEEVKGGIWHKSEDKPAGRTYKGTRTIHTNPECPCYMLDEQQKGVSRFFYIAKVSKSERNMGCEALEDKEGIRTNVSRENENKKISARKNNHPTVKPLKLMEYLVRLVTPPNGIVLDPFLGSGTTAMACKAEGFNFIGIEKEPEYVKIAEARIKAIPKKLI
jgi:site-specific DNA-methyltransferase (adenine-specific)